MENWFCSPAHLAILESTLLPTARNEITATLFKYRCRCGAVDFLKYEDGRAQCVLCGARYPVSPAGILDFVQTQNEQNAYFDAIYSSGHLDKAAELYETADRTYRSTIEIAQEYLKRCGCDVTGRLENLSILDVACGAGWITAGLLQHPAIHNCKLHAFDISAEGLELLARFERTIQSTNRLEMSVQDATTMAFEDASFDIVAGSSVLHHFDDVEQFLTDCRRILKPGGVMTFGEPFAVGYGLGSAVLMIAQKKTGKQYQAVENLYNDIACRIKKPPEFLKQLVDKHLFFQSSFLSLAQRAGFPSVEFIALSSREYYRNYFINELLLEQGISDPVLAETANEMYRMIFDLFDAESFVHSTAAFIQIVLRA